jgi:hypothetical protein
MLASISPLVPLVWLLVVLLVLSLNTSVVCHHPSSTHYDFLNLKLTNELDEDSERSDVEEAYEDGRRDEAYEDDGGGFFD